MKTERVERRLAAILVADMVGYSRLMGEDEAGTLARQKSHRAELIDPKIAEYNGRIVKTTGDGLLVEFSSAVDAVLCAVEVQRGMVEREMGVPEDRRIAYRIGINLGDIIHDGDDIFGDGVNVAARLEQLSEPGGIRLSDVVFKSVKGKLDLGFADFGPQKVKNIAEPVSTFGVLLDPADVGKIISSKPSRQLSWRWLAGGAVAVIVAIAGGTASWLLMAPPESAPQQTVAEADDPILALPTGPTIAVLPLVNLSGDPEQEYFVDGLTADLVNRLSRYQHFKVIARNSTTQYKDKTVDLETIERDLGARFVVDGGVRRSGERLRVTVALTDTSDGAQLWSETYDRDLSAADVFDIQDDIASRVVAVIADNQGIVLRADVKAAAGKPPADLNSYDCQLRLVAYYDSITPDEHAVIRDCAERAVEKYPTDAGSWRVLAAVYLDESRYNLNARPGSLDRALDAARRALQLNANDDSAHYALAQIHFHRNEMDSFLVESEQALVLNPNNAAYLASIGLKLIEAGILDRGIAMVNKAVDLNPNHPVWYHWAYYHYHFRRGEYEAALSAVQKVGWPNFFWTHAQTAAALGHLGRLGEARASVDRLLELYPDFANNFWEEIAKYNFPDEDSMLYVEGYRKAGLDVPDKPKLTQ